MERSEAIVSGVAEAHDLARIGRAVDQGQPGGLRVMAWCACGWHTRPTLTAQLARSDLDEHVAQAPDSA